MLGEIPEKGDSRERRSVMLLTREEGRWLVKNVVNEEI